MIILETKLSNDKNSQDNETDAETRSPVPSILPSDQLADHISSILEEQSAEEIIRIDLRGKSSIADFMIVASGRSNRHVGALADYVQKGLKDEGYEKLGIEGLEQCDWVLLDAGDVILHLFRPEVREFYALEKMWTAPSLGYNADDIGSKSYTPPA